MKKSMFLPILFFLVASPFAFAAIDSDFDSMLKAEECSHLGFFQRISHGCYFATQSFIGAPTFMIPGESKTFYFNLADTPCAGKRDATVSWKPPVSIFDVVSVVNPSECLAGGAVCSKVTIKAKTTASIGNYVVNVPYSCPYSNLGGYYSNSENTKIQIGSSCTPDCQAKGISRCSGKAWQVCSDISGCLKWNTVKTCSLEETCNPEAGTTFEACKQTICSSYSITCTDKTHYRSCSPDGTMFLPTNYYTGSDKVCIGNRIIPRYDTFTETECINGKITLTKHDSLFDQTITDTKSCEIKVDCIPSVECSEFGACVDGIKKRYCSDINACGTDAPRTEEENCIQEDEMLGYMIDGEICVETDNPDLIEYSTYEECEASIPADGGDGSGDGSGDGNGGGSMGTFCMDSEFKIGEECVPKSYLYFGIGGILFLLILLVALLMLLKGKPKRGRK